MVFNTINMEKIIKQNNTLDGLEYFDGGTFEDSYDKNKWTYSYYVKTAILATEINLTIWEALSNLLRGKYREQVKLMISEDNYVVVCYKTHIFKNGTAALKYFAKNLVSLTKAYIEYYGLQGKLEWKRSCREPIVFLYNQTQVVRVADVYKMYDLLLQRDLTKYNY